MRVGFGCVLFSAVILTAQSLEPSLIGSGGQSAPAGSYTLDWSLGEAVIGPSDTGATTTFGFQQYENPPPVALAKPTTAALRIRAFPGRLSIWLGEESRGVTARLYDIQGKTLAQRTAIPGQKELVLSTRHLPGMLLLDLDFGDGRRIRGHKLFGGH